MMLSSEFSLEVDDRAGDEASERSNGNGNCPENNPSQAFALLATNRGCGWLLTDAESMFSTISLPFV